MTYTPSAWATALLKQLGAPVTSANVTAMVNWARAEGGHWSNRAMYNPLNTTQRMPGASSFNSVGVRAYSDWNQGLAATVKTLRNGRYDSVLSALQAGNNPNAVWDAVLASPWGTKSIPRGKGQYAPAAPTIDTGTGPSAASQALSALQQAGIQTGDSGAMPEALGAASPVPIGAGPAGASALGTGPTGVRPEPSELMTIPTRQEFESATGFQGTPGASGQFPAVTATGLRGNIVSTAQTFLGQPYKWGGLDCSGLVQRVFGRFGINLPRVSFQQARAGQRVGLGQLQPGDLVAWDNSSRNNGADHIAIYIGGGRIIEAARPGTNVRIRKLGRERGAWGVRMDLD